MDRGRCFPDWAVSDCRNGWKWNDELQFSLYCTVRGETEIERWKDNNMLE